MMKQLFIFFIMCWLSNAWAQSNMQIELVIGAEKVACKDNDQMLCFAAKKTTDPTWTFTIETIEGFDFVPGKIAHVLLNLSTAEVNGQVKPVYQLVEVIHQEEE